MPTIVSKSRRPGVRPPRVLAPYFFLAPFILIFAVFFLYPLGMSLVMSLRSYAGPNVHRWVGLSHYRFLLEPTLSPFWISVANTISYTLLFLLFQVPLSLGLALALNSKRVRFRAVYRLAMLMPFLAGNVLVAVIFTPLLSPRQGLINRFLAVFSPGWRNLNWKTDPLLATLAILLAVLWLSVGWGMVYLLAALQGVEPELYEAAETDGASSIRRFFHVTLPSIRPVLAYLVLVGTLSGLQLFELPYVFFQGLGPKLRGLTIVQYLVLSGFDRGDLGMAAAVGWVLVACISLITLPQVRRLMKAGVS